MEEHNGNDGQDMLSKRQAFIKRFVIDRAKGNADYLMKRYLEYFEPKLKHASYTDEKAYQYIINEYEKIHEGEFAELQAFLNVDKPEIDLIWDIDVSYLLPLTKKSELEAFLESEGGFKLVSELCKSILLNNKLDYLKSLLRQRKFDHHRTSLASKSLKTRHLSETKNKPLKIGKLDHQTVLWRDVMQTEELANEVLKTLEKRGFIKSFEASWTWLDIEPRPLQVVVALATVLSKKGYFKRAFSKIHASATINQFGLEFDTKNFSNDNRMKAFDKFGKEFYFIPEADKLK